jgi:hypothetical protein
VPSRKLALLTRTAVLLELAKPRECNEATNPPAALAVGSFVICWWAVGGEIFVAAAQVVGDCRTGVRGVSCVLAPTESAGAPRASS